MSKVSTTVPDDAFLAGGSTAVLARLGASKAHSEMTAFINAEVNRPDFNPADLMLGICRQMIGVQGSLAAQFLQPSGDEIMREGLITIINDIFCEHTAAVREHLAQEHMEATP